MSGILYPLKFHPIYKEKTWGGRGLEKLGRKLPGGPEFLIGESWELTDLDSSSSSGGGGGAEHSVVRNGPLKGKTLRQVVIDHGSDLFGKSNRLMNGFPLLIKILDLDQLASLQVHPDEAYVQQHPGAFLKSEAWYILEARPDAVIYKGVRPGVTPPEFESVVRAGNVGAVVSLLNREAVRSGDCHYVPGGTLHAMGGGVLALEIQTPSDTTFRLFDWGRTGREMHVRQAMQCLSFEPCMPADPGPLRASGSHAAQQLAACRHFRVMRRHYRPGCIVCECSSSMVVWFVLEGCGQAWLSGGSGETSFRRGEMLLIPHPGSFDIAARFDEVTTLLEITIPTQDQD